MVVINMINMLSGLEFLFGRPSYDIDNSVKTNHEFLFVWPSYDIDKSVKTNMRTWAKLGGRGGHGLWLLKCFSCSIRTISLSKMSTLEMLLFIE